jgi:hypothetical protein
LVEHWQICKPTRPFVRAYADAEASKLGVVRLGPPGEMGTTALCFVLAVLLAGIRTTLDNLMANRELSIPGRNVDSLREFRGGADQGNSLAASAASTLANGFSALSHDWLPSP